MPVAVERRVFRGGQLMLIAIDVVARNGDDRFDAAAAGGRLPAG